MQGAARVAIAVLMLASTSCGLFSRGETLPPDTAPARRSQPLEDGRFREWPESGQAREGVEYTYETGHCGLTYDLDFDGSFWEAINPNGDDEPPSFFINYDKGYITLVSEDEAIYEASTGESVELRRVDGPIVTGGCA